uniref:Leucine-rich repeat and IQ domain-containing protein 1 n=1 Tax=Magallana gigas TaxID=29159 RepID=K1QF97_MAGGI
MDDDALIEAEIAQQLDQINLEADDFQFDENEVDFQDDDLDFPLEDQEVVLPAEMSDYINQIQRQASDFEKELAECDELIQHQTPGPKTLLNEDELGILEQLARERGESPETYRKRVLEEEEDFALTDYSTLVSDDKDQHTDANDNSMALVHLDERQLEFQKIFQENLRKMEETQKQREERLQQEIQEDKKREWDDFEEKEKKWMDKFASLQKEETQLVAERKMQQEKFEIELKDKENQFERELKYYEEEIKKLESETKQEQEQLDLERSEELKRQEVKQQTSATKIQACFRGYSEEEAAKKIAESAREEAVVESKEKKNVLRKSHVRMSQETSGSPRPKSARSRPKSAAKRSEDLDIFDMDDTKKFKVSNEPWKLKTGTSKSMRRPTSAKKLQALSEDTILMAARVSTLRQVTTVELRDLPGCNISTLGQCWGLKSLKMSKCNLTVDNFIQYVDLKDLSNLTFLDLSHNSLSSIHGLSGCSNLRWLDLSKNKITRIGGTESLRRLHTLKLSHNQLISTTGLNDTPTLQMIDMSSNHLQTVEDVSNIEDLVPLNNLLILKHLDISHNQILEVESVSASVTKCVHLESLSVAGNPFTELTDLDLSLPSLKRIDERVLGSGGTEVKPRTSFEAMCLSQTKVFTELANSLLKDVGAEKSKLPLDLGALCDLYFKYCDTTQKLAEEHRYAHEYGEITMAVPTAPSTPKSSQRPPSSKSVRQAQRESHLLNPKEMFERAVKTSEKGNKEGETAMNGESLASLSGSMDGRIHAGLNEKKPPNLTAKAVKALVDEDFGVSHSSKVSDLQNVAAAKIQACWRGHRVRRRIWGTEVMGQGLDEVDQEILRELHQAATKIQAVWRGYILRVKLEQALEFAKFEDEDDFDFQEVDLKDFNFNEEMLDDWKPPPTPQLPANHPVLGKPPIGKLSSPPGKIPSLNLGDKPQPPGNPRSAWRGMDSPLSEAPQNGHVPRPPSIISATDTHRTAMSKKEEQISEEWGFRDANTAHVMMQRAKKLKYNAERRKKLGKLDPKQRLALFRRLEETNVTRKPVSQPSRQTLPRKEYFQARQEEIEKQELEKRVMANLRNSRTFEWLHNQVGSFEDQEPHLQHHPQPQPHSVCKNMDIRMNIMIKCSIKYDKTPFTNRKLMRQMYDNNLPRLDPQGGRNIRLTGSPAMDLQSVDSVSLQGEMIQPPRRFSAGSEASSGARFPPIKTNSAGSGQKRERISFRDNEVKLGIGWGGGRKRGQRM